MEHLIDNNDECGTHGIPTLVSNSPTSLSTTDVPVLRLTTDPEPDHGTIYGTASTTAAGIIGSSNTSSDSNVDTTSSDANDESHTGSSVISDCPIRASGQMCICDLCEATRMRLLQVLRQSNSHGNATETEDPSHRIQQNGMSHSHPTVSERDSSTTTRNKRSRQAYKYGGDEQEEEDDIDHGSDIPPANAVAHTRRHHNEMTSKIAVTEVVTTAPSVINPINSKDTNHAQNHSDGDAEQQKLQIMSRACRTILQCIGEDPDREGLQKTPERWAKALLYLCHGYHLSPSQVTNNAVFYENHNEMVVVRNIDVHSLCEHHMVPFTGHVHIGYIPNGKIIGLSKLARLADLFARRLQVQERLTRQIADAILETITPLGVAVVMECTHYCMVMRGVQKTGAITTTSSVRGCFETNSKTRAEFFSILHGGGK